MNFEFSFVLLLAEVTASRNIASAPAPEWHPHSPCFERDGSCVPQ